MKGRQINWFTAENRYLLSLNLKCYFCTDRSSKNAEAQIEFDFGAQKERGGERGERITVDSRVVSLLRPPG